MEQSLQVIASWLEAKRVELWGDFLISDPERRALAAEWFSHEMADLARFAEFGVSRRELGMQEQNQALNGN